VNDPAEDVNSDSQWNALDCQGATGAVGPTGPQGVQGPQGASGLQGVQGVAGPSGPAGATGLTGTNCWDTNNNGAQDPAEDINSDGLWNALDCQGITGATGAAGVNGMNCWDTNNNGTQDPAEDVNTDGFWNALDCQGATGVAGATGATGAAGINGLNCWDTNNNGTQDPAEDVNTDGFWNALDCQGAVGPVGPSGAQGIQGVAGPSGPQGIQGPAGPSGAQGIQGVAGPSGPQGVQGPAGPSGAQGIQGVAGPTGPSWTLSSVAFNASGTMTVNGTAGSGGPLTSTTGAWLTTGNSGLTTANNFIGTTDAVDLVFRTANGPRMQISGSTGNVGIGVASSGARLAVWGSGNTSSSTSFDIRNSSGNSAMFVRDDLKIGIGNTGPTARFEIWGLGNSSATSSFFVRDVAGNPVIYVTDDRKVVFGSTTNLSSRFEFWGFGNSSATSTLNVLNTSGNSTFFVRDDGNVGIGTNSPAATLTVGANKFQVNGAEGDLTFLDPNASITFPASAAGSPPMMYMFATGTTNATRMVIAHSPTYPDYGLQYDDTPDKFHFISAGTPVLTVDFGLQAVGIGQPNPSNKLDVGGTVGMTGFYLPTSASYGKVLTSDFSGYGTWQYPLTPAKFGELGTVYNTNNSTQYSYTPVVLTITPQSSGVVVLSGSVGYNYDAGLASMVDFGYYISTNPAAPTSSTAFTSSTTTAGYAIAEGSAFCTTNVPLNYSFSVIAGQTYYIYVGMLDGSLAAQTNAKMMRPKVTATLHTSTGL
jgi:hypothetical protein